MAPPASKTPGSCPTARSYLYVPAHKDDVVAKALASEADAVVLDLEDAVPPSAKAHARQVVSELTSRPSSRTLWVRVNAVRSGLTELDLSAAVGPSLAGVRLAKVGSAAEVRLVGDALSAANCEAAIDCLIESAAGLDAIAEIARAHPAVHGLMLGEADLAADLGVTGDEGLTYAQGRCVAAARGAGLPAPVQSVFLDVAAEAELRRTTIRGRGLGFFGRSAIHPRQLRVINEVFTPALATVSAARALVDRFCDANDGGVAAFVLDDGRFVDAAVIAAARRTLALAEKWGSRT